MACIPTFIARGGDDGAKRYDGQICALGVKEEGRWRATEVVVLMLMEGAVVAGKGKMVKWITHYNYIFFKILKYKGLNIFLILIKLANFDFSL